MALPRIVSLFSGAGGLDLGFHEAGFDVAFAIDKMPAAIATHKHNFPDAESIAADLVELNPSGVLAKLASVLSDGEAIGVIGGPPCQGFSRANTKSVADDPRNKLPILYLEIVERLQERYDVQFVLFENVMGIRDSKHALTFRGLLSKFQNLGLTTDVSEHSALNFGVPQARNRVVISGFKDEAVREMFAPQHVTSTDLTVRGAIGDLPAPAFFVRGIQASDIPHHENHWTMRPVSTRFNNPDENHPQPARSFRRLAWDKPSPTVAYGHREIHVHPNGTRRISIYEAMILQGFPKSFVLKGTLSAQVEQISNAVPPPLARALAAAIAAALQVTSSGNHVSEVA